MNRAICGDFKPENFPAAQSIYSGFVERNIPAIPTPLGSRGSKGLLHEKKDVCANEVLHSDCQWYLFEKIRSFCFSQSADSVCPKPTVPNPTYAGGNVVEKEFKNKKKKKKKKEKKKKRKLNDLL